MGLFAGQGRGLTAQDSPSVTRERVKLGPLQRLISPATPTQTLSQDPSLKRRRRSTVVPEGDVRTLRWGCCMI